MSDAATVAASGPATATAATASAARALSSAAGATRGAGSTGESTGPWWRHPMMWLVVGGPSVVVVASFITLTLAVRHGDPVVEHGNQAGSAQVSAEEAGTESAARAQTASFAANGTNDTNGANSANATAKALSVDDPALQPAMRARNHAATGGKEH